MTQNDSDPDGDTLTLAITSGASHGWVGTPTGTYQVWYEPAAGYSGSDSFIYSVCLMYYRARFYDPQVGRFISEDPVGFAGGHNWYSYVSNSPTNLTDPSGLWETDAHNEIIDQAFKYCLDNFQRDQLKEASRDMDRLGNQGAKNAYQHGMRAPWENVDFARSAANKFISDQEEHGPPFQMVAKMVTGKYPGMPSESSEEAYIRLLI